MGARGLTAVIAPAAWIERLRDALARAGVPFGEAARDGLSSDVTLVSAAECKGLEFDGVIVVEPAEIVAEPAGGLRLLYVAITRAMRDLVVVHAKPLPEPLAHGRARRSVHEPRST